MSAAPAAPLALPLEGVRIVAIEQYGAGPWGTLQLADLGAEVIKIEDPAAAGDVGRYVPPYQDGSDSLFFETFNRNKKSVALDLRAPEGRRILERLAAEADVLFSNLRGDLPARLAIRYADLAHLNPRLVCCSLSGFGMTGPRASQGAYDHTVQALSGWQSLTGEPGGPPTRTGLSLVDFATGYVAAIAILGALARAQRDGIGGDVDVALFDTALSLLTYFATWTASCGYEPQRQSGSAHPSMVPFQNLRTQDGWIVVACPKEELWRKLCAALGREELLVDPRFEGFAARLAHREAVVVALEATLTSAPTAHWVALLQEAGVPAAQVNDVAAALADPQAQARGAIVEVEHPVLGAVRQVASPLRIDRMEGPLRRAPTLGEHTSDVLQQLCGLSPEEVAALAAAGVVRTAPDAPAAATRPRAEPGAGR